ncbi:MAG: type II toxin-antitoxin system HipA family toxin [Pseudomonadota bacterium]
MSTSAWVELWGRRIAGVSWDAEREHGVFQYTPAFAASAIEVAPLTMPLRTAPYRFTALPRESFHGLPGLLADCLPDRFGNTLINAWLAEQGRTPASFNPVERLCYIGSRAMGALEFKPSIGLDGRAGRRIALDGLVTLANRVLDERLGLTGALGGHDDRTDIENILRVGTSAGGARAKAVLAWHPDTGAFRSGQVAADSGYQHWLVKFDGVHGNRDKELADPQGFGRIEYAYARMAADAGIDMSPSRLFEEGGRAHFMTRRFDRRDDGAKWHMQSLAAMRHFDFNAAGSNSYEEAIQTLRQLGLPALDVEQQVRRAVFNVLARNQDDHVKNIAFLMDSRGDWRLSPAFDVTYAYNPDGAWTSQHQMSLNGKRRGFTRDDLVRFAAYANLKKRKADALIEDALSALGAWPGHARDAGVDPADAARIARSFRWLS